MDYIKQSVAANEALILKLDTLALEISNGTGDAAAASDSLLTEITQLTQELKYYK